MKLFRAQENTPDVYPRKSRDFQLLCNILDCINGAVKYDIDSIRHVTDTNLCNDSLLTYLQTKLGFFTNIHMDVESQRIILRGFPYIVKNKGSTKGILQAIYLFLKSQHIDGEVSLNVRNRENLLDIGDSENVSDDKLSLVNTYVVEISTNVVVSNLKVLNEILKYILPAGYLVEYLFYETYNYGDYITNDDQIRIIFAKNVINRQVRSCNEDSKENDDDRLLVYDKIDATSIGGVSTAKLLSVDYSDTIFNDNDKDNDTADNRYEPVVLWDTYDYSEGDA